MRLPRVLLAVLAVTPLLMGCEAGSSHAGRAEATKAAARVAWTAPPTVSSASEDALAAATAGEPIAVASPVRAAGFVVAEPLPTSEPPFVPTVPPTPTTDPFLALGPPLQLEIPAIGVSSSVELVGLTNDGAMDVPKAWMNVGWYRDGYRPGEPGNAVLAGHLDTSSGGPAVFWSLDRLQPGDEVIVSYGNGDRYVFVVEGQELYRHDAQGPIIDRIFGESLTPDLNLVTCDGAWDHGRATYSHRLVVFATLAPDRTARANGGSGGTLE